MRRILLVVLATALMALGLGVPAAAGEPDLVTVIGPFAVDSPEGAAFVEELSAFADQKGFSVVYEDYSGVADLIDRVEGEDPPDVVVTPQPGTLFEIEDDLVDLSGIVKSKKLDKAFGGYLMDVATADDGAVLGAPISLDLKSLVWYEPAEFEAEGYQVPETFDELVTLSNDMVADGETPWCNYMESGFATGWVGTDWVEDLLLSTDGPDVYDDWVDHTVIFQDLRVEAAFERYQQMIDTPGYVFERSNMVTVPFFDNAGPLDAGDCLMHRQGTFFAAFLGTYGADLDDFATFKFPAVNAEFSDSAIGGGAHVAVLDDRKAVEKLTSFMLSKKFGETALASTGRWILPHAGFNQTLYPDDLSRSWADIIRTAVMTDLFRYDASDMMPPEVGAGSFWSGIVDLVDGTKFIPQVLSDIDASWPN